MTASEYDLIVIGAGPVGENVADRANAGGLSVLIVEESLVGGDCSFYACVPSKALLASGAVLRAASSVGGAREAITGSLDVGAVLARRNYFVSDYSDSADAKWLESVRIDLIRGHGRLLGVKTVEVTRADGPPITVTARHAVSVCCGSAPRVPDISGLADLDPWTSRDATSVTTVPASLLVIGGGVVAAEMATAFTDLGSAVTVVARSGLLGGVEDFAAAQVQEGLLRRGVRILTGRTPTAARRVAADGGGADGGGADGVGSGGSEAVQGEAVQGEAVEGEAVELVLDDGSTIVADQILVAAGRIPRTWDLGLESIGLTPGDWITVDDTLRSTKPGLDWLYAVGDVNHRALLTHQGKYQARAAGDVIAARATSGDIDGAPWGRHVATADHHGVPQVIFTSPQVASVGLTRAQAAEAGLATRVLEVELGSVTGAALHADGYTGTARAIVDTDRQVIVGVTLVGAEVAELLQAATMVVVGEVPLKRLWHAVPAFPTMNEFWLRLLEQYGRE